MDSEPDGGIACPSVCRRCAADALTFDPLVHRGPGPCLTIPAMLRESLRLLVRAFIALQALKMLACMSVSGLRRDWTCSRRSRREKSLLVCTAFSGVQRVIAARERRFDVRPRKGRTNPPQGQCLIIAWGHGIRRQIVSVPGRPWSGPRVQAVACQPHCYSCRPQNIGKFASSRDAPVNLICCRAAVVGWVHALYFSIYQIIPACDRSSPIVDCGSRGETPAARRLHCVCLDIALIAFLECASFLDEARH